LTVSGQAQVQLSEVVRRYGGPSGLQALGPVNLEIRCGEFFSIVGPSGCGKSTLLDVAAGLVVPTSGSVCFEGKELHGEVPDGIGVVFQEDASMPWLSVRDNVAFGLRTSGLPRKEVADRVDHAIDFMGLAQFAGHYPAQLSGGMRQRVCIARTLVLRPRLILLDEPFGALDQILRRSMNLELQRIWLESRATTVLVTHGIDEALFLADRIVVMQRNPGRIACIIDVPFSRPRSPELFAAPEFHRLEDEVATQLFGAGGAAAGDAA
jgi:NitT/TauT family transport system ATP-binding protein